MTHVESIQDAIAVINDHSGAPEHLVLSLPELLFGATDLGEGQLATGVAAAILADSALARGWMPQGATVVDGRRVWTFGEL